jgi:hypothetical protein
MSSIFDEAAYASRCRAWISLVAGFRQQVEEYAKSRDAAFSCDEPLAQELFASLNGSVISVWMQPGDGHASWNLIRDDLDMAEPWSLSADNTVFLDNEAMSIDAAALRFAEKLNGAWFPRNR